MPADTGETTLAMKFITYSGLNRDNIAGNLGQNDYSYFFVLQDFLPLLQQFGEVLITDQLDWQRCRSPLLHCCGVVVGSLVSCDS